ncbi:MAG: serine/threonine protein kinase [Rhizobiales bacterium]|nr:serine/threonine protein kinase [Hyphomicrobiales bacterium]
MSRAVDPRLARSAAQARPTVLPPHLGTRLNGRYELIQVIGRGGMSTVYHAVDHVRLRARVPQPHVAVKLAALAPPYDEAARALIHREAHRTLDLIHPNIVRVYDSDQDGESHFLVMELLQGRTLGTVLRETEGKGLEGRQVRGVVQCVGSALAFAHARGMMHGDLKPGNVFVGLDGSVKVLDFGLSHGAPQPDAGEDSTIRLLDLVGALTPTFASPERLEGADPSPACDLFAFGVLIYLMTSGHHPFQRRTALEAREAGAEPLRPEGLTGPQWAALRSLLQFDPAARPRRMEDFCARFLAEPWSLPRIRGRLRLSAPFAPARR